MSVRILEDHVVNRIAAGEVVERPASVVKELVENALDAGPSELRVEIEVGGKRLIRVVDDGSGMARQDAMLCIERHATSKIRSDADLLHVTTMGFRGEALPSIASVSRFQLVTRRAEDDEGTRIVIEGGKLVAVQACGCAPGTEVTVRDLFFNVPARRSFLRTTQTEYSHCVEAVTRVALVRPSLDVTLVHNDRQTLRAPAGAGLMQRVASLLGPYGEALRPVRFSRGAFTVSGLVSPVGVHRSNAAGGIQLYVNGRYVRDPVLRKAVLEAYHGLVPMGRYPVVVLQLEMPPDQVDMNVHPTKVEVRFRSPRDVRAAVSEGLREGLREHGLHAQQPRIQPATATPPARPEPPRQAPLPMHSTMRLTPQPAAPRPGSTPLPPPPALPPELAADPVAAPQAPQPSRPSPEPAPGQPDPGSPAPQGVDFTHPILPVGCFSDLNVIGQLAESYVLCEGAGELVVIDQHAAHERVTLERLQRIQREAKPVSQTLLTPVKVPLPAGRAEALEPHLGLLAAVGMDIRPDSAGGFEVHAVPPALGNVDIARLVRDTADDLADEGSGEPVRDLVDKVLSTLACHSSVRANQRLSIYEMRALLRSLDRVDFGVCAHGRPVALRISPRELESRFHRS